MRAIIIRGAAEHNLKNVSLEIPAGTLTVFTGVSGSGKSSLAYDTIYREGQRRFLESLSSYARQYLGSMERPRVERIEGLSPTVSIDQKTVGRSPRSTVGTITEVYDHLRLLFARLGTPHCPRCGRRIESQTAARIADQVLLDYPGRPLYVAAPVVRHKKGEYKKKLEDLRSEGHVRLRIDGAMIRLDKEEPPLLARYEHHTIEIVLDRLTARPEDRARLTESVEKCLELAGGLVTVLLPPPEGGEEAAGASADRPLEERLFSSRFACPDCGEGIPELEPRLFSFNSPHGACPDCQGLGLRKLDGEEAPGSLGLRIICDTCGGTRLRREARAVRFQDKTITELVALPSGKLAEFFAGLELHGNAAVVGKPIVKEITARLTFLRDVGLDYLSLDRSAATLAGGEAQRIRLAGQVGAALQGVLFVLDEPSIGLHPRDNQRLLGTLLALRDNGNTVLVVEHDRETIEAADHIVDIGPGAGREGGEVVAEGLAEDVARAPRSLTGPYLSGARSIPVPERRRSPDDRWLEIEGATHNNLRGIDVRFPLGLLVVVTGVSGSGKSSLIDGVLRPALQGRLRRRASSRLRSLKGAEHVAEVVDIDQRPIGRSPRSNPATYTKLFGLVRDLYASLPEARVRGYGPERFSFNRDSGRCLQCRGAGVIEVEMQFLAPVEMVCDDCGGRRYNRETLEITYRGRSIAQVLAMPVREAREFFRDHPKIHRILEVMEEVGLGYVELGQPSTTLSGGEAQRVKLAAELHRIDSGRTLYLLDEPTTGLHFEDVRVLLAALQALVNRGNTVLVVEHNPEVMKTADWIVDLGPEGGEAGGRVVAAGPPEEIAKSPESRTGLVLARELGGAAGTPAEARKRMKRGRRTPPPSMLVVEGASRHNLKGVNVAIPKGSLTVITGVSGSGKSSLAFDTIFTEGQRRYLESLSTYARRFLGRMESAPLDRIEGLSPAIAIDQKSAPRSPRSTVATITEIHDHLRLLYARIGRPYCPQCDLPLSSTTPTRLAGDLARQEQGRRAYLLAPISPAAAGLCGSSTDRADARAALLKEGFTRLLSDGRELRIDEEAAGERDQAPPAEVFLVVDRVELGEESRTRVASALETAFERGGGRAGVQVVGSDPVLYSREPACASCGFRLPETLTPRMFSFNSHVGACPRCMGIGVEARVVPDLLIENPVLPLLNGALYSPVHYWLTRPGSHQSAVLEAMAGAKDIPLEKPWRDLDEESRRAILHGTGQETYDANLRLGGGRRRGDPSFDFRRTWRGLVDEVEEWYREVRANMKPGFLDPLLQPSTCSNCGGGRLRPEFLKVRLGAAGPGGKGLGIAELTGLSVSEAARFFDELALDRREAQIAEQVMVEIKGRLRFLLEVGLDYLTLDRAASSLSGGEAQRIRLASQIGNRLVGVLYVLDEPTVGLHPRDTQRLLQSLCELRDLGNTVIVVEHDRETIEAADHIIDMGPGAGSLGGEVLAEGPPAKIRSSRRSITGRYLRGELRVAPQREPRAPVQEPDGRIAALRLRGVRNHNLKGIDVEFPLGLFTAVSGVSGSGKSSLVVDVLGEALRKELDGRGRSGERKPRGRPRQAQAEQKALAERTVLVDRQGLPDRKALPEMKTRTAGEPAPLLEEMQGAEAVKRLILIDQSPIGQSPRSNPATYTGLWDQVRELFARVPQARLRGYSPARFSFNLPGGRCEACNGEGAIRVEMHFLSDVWIPCEECKGSRFNRGTLEVRYRGLHAGDVLGLEVDRALEVFSEHPRARAILEVLHDVGLGYIKLGQSSTTLSGGEAQRVKLAAELTGRPGGGSFYILDEPTTGLHFDDVRKLLVVLHRLVDAGNTMVVIEHNLDVIRSADWVIDLGPEGGDRGGNILAAGPPAALARVAESHTGKFLARQTAVAAKRAAAGKAK